MLELGARITVDLTYGPGVGYPYEQRELRRAIARLSQGARVLDPSCHVGGLFIHAGNHGARSILAFDSDADTAELARENGEANGLQGRLQVERGDSLSVLRGLHDTFDLVLLDTPEVSSPESFLEQVRLGLHVTRHGGVLVVVG